MNKQLLYLFLWLCPLPIYAMSTALFPDGIARVTLKDNYPCVYLSNGKKILYMQFSGQKSPKGVRPTIPDGSSREQCVFFDGGAHLLQYNVPIVIYVDHLNTGFDQNTHITSFCVIKEQHTTRLVATKQGECSNQAWKPTKDYIGLFGKIERFIDWLFNLNGYTKETF